MPQYDAGFCGNQVATVNNLKQSAELSDKSQLVNVNFYLLCLEDKYHTHVPDRAGLDCGGEEGRKADQRKEDILCK